MAGYETQKRILVPDRLYPAFPNAVSNRLALVRSGFDTSSFRLLTPVPLWSSQTTRSWRSNGRGRGLEERTVSEILEKSKNWQTPYDQGHEFTTSKFEVAYLSHPKWYMSGLNGAWVRLPLIPSVSSWWSVEDPLAAGLSRIGNINTGVGTTLLRSSMPDNPVANLAQTLSELVVDLPRLPFAELAAASTKVHRNRSLLRAGGSEYLNTVFAWQPLVQDVLRICDAIVRSNDIIQQYVRDSGADHFVHRVRETDPVRSAATTVVPDVWAAVGANRIDASALSSRLYPNGADVDTRKPVTIVESSFQEYRLACAWTYFLSTHEGGWLEQLQVIASKANKVLGLKFDLELIWELAPWSWLADWFVNIGDIIALNTRLASDSLLLRYGYLTRKSQIDIHLEHPGLTSWSGKSGPITNHLRYTRHERVRATPYGFGPKLGDFTSQQLAILVALGMTGSPTKASWG